MKDIKRMLEMFDECCEGVKSSDIRDIDVLVNGVRLMLKQMKLIREKSIELRKNFEGTSEELVQRLVEESGKSLEMIRREADKIDPLIFNTLIFALPNRKGRVFFEVMAEYEEIGKLAFDDPARRERVDKNIERMESFLDYLKKHKKKINEERRKMIKPVSKERKALQLRISLCDSDPIIWRVFLVEDNITFHELHFIIQKVMGWKCSHLYMFEKGRLRIESEEYAEGEYTDFEPAEKLLIRQVLSEGDKLNYLYDFGDSWEHEILVEKISGIEEGKEYPLCIDGSRACPPEDCGGIYGFYEMLRAVKDKKHADHEHLKEWLGEYDPELFVVDWANAILRGKKPKAGWNMKDENTRR